MLVGALVLAAGAAGFYGIKHGNPFEESIDRQSQGSMRIGTSPIQPLSEDRGMTSDSVTLTPAAEGEQRGSAKDMPNSPIGGIEPEPAPTAQDTSRSEVVARGVVLPATDVPKRATTQARGSDDATPARSLTTTPGRARAVPPRKPIPESSQQRPPAQRCTDSVAALGLCGVTSGRTLK